MMYPCATPVSRADFYNVLCGHTTDLITHVEFQVDCWGIDAGKRAFPPKRFDLGRFPSDIFPVRTFVPLVFEDIKQEVACAWNLTFSFQLILIVAFRTVLRTTVLYCNHGANTHKKFIALCGKPTTKLRSVTCHMGSRSVICHPIEINASRLNSSQKDRYSIYLL